MSSILKGMIDETDPQIAVRGGAGTYSLENLKKKAEWEATDLARQVSSGDYRQAAYNVQQLANTLATIAEHLASQEEIDEDARASRAQNPELLRAANRNLVDLASGEVRRREQARKDSIKADREWEKTQARWKREDERERMRKIKDPTFIWNKIENVMSRYFPDGDPTDELNPWMERNGLNWDDITRACKKEGYKDLWDYWNTLGQDIENDAYADWHAAKRPESPANPLSKDAADIQHRDWMMKGGAKRLWPRVPTMENSSSILKGILGASD